MIGQPADGRDVEPTQERVEQAELRVQHPREDDGDHHRGGDHREEEGGLIEPLPGHEARVDDQRQQQRQRREDEHAAERVVRGVEHGPQVPVVLDEVSVVGQAHEGLGPEAEALQEAEPERIDDRVEPEDHEQQEKRGDEQVGCDGTLVARPPATLRASIRRRCLCCGCHGLLLCSDMG